MKKFLSMLLILGLFAALLLASGEKSHYESGEKSQFASGEKSHK